MERTVLIVDDEDNIRTALLRVLRKQPYKVLTARTADDAMSFLKRHSVDLVISDEQMPGMRGTQLLAWVAEYFPNVVRILLTGKATAETTRAAMDDSKVFRFLTKPCPDTELAAAIRAGLAERERQQAAVAQP